MRVSACTFLSMTRIDWPAARRLCRQRQISSRMSGAKPSVAASSASPDVAVQIYNRGVHNQMLARLSDGQTIPQVIAWAQDELDGYTR